MCNNSQQDLAVKEYDMLAYSIKNTALLEACMCACVCMCVCVCACTVQARETCVCPHLHYAYDVMVARLLQDVQHACLAARYPQPTANKVRQVPLPTLARFHIPGCSRLIVLLLLLLLLAAQWSQVITTLR